MKSQSNYRWFVVAVFFVFMLLHQCDKLLIGPLTTPIMEEFGINHAQMGFITTGALIVGAFFYPLWGYLYDRYARAKLLALASFIVGGDHLDQRDCAHLSDLYGDARLHRHRRFELSGSV